MNKCYVISRDQVSRIIDIAERPNIESAEKLVKENRMYYKDSIYVTLDDLKKLSNKIDDILYDMHCDYANPRDKKNIKELRKRLSWFIEGCTLEHIHVTKSKLVL